MTRGLVGELLGTMRFEMQRSAERAVALRLAVEAIDHGGMDALVELILQAAHKKGINVAGLTGGATPHRGALTDGSRKAEDARPVADRQKGGPPARRSSANTTTAKCGACKKTLPAGSFAKNRSRPNGLQSICRRCHSERYSKKPAAAKVAKEPEPVRVEAPPAKVRRGAEPLRKKDRAELLRERAALRAGASMWRCKLPRVPDQNETKLTEAGVCGALLFQRQLEDHARDYHGLTVTKKVIAAGFEPAAAVEDDDDSEAA